MKNKKSQALGLAEAFESGADMSAKEKEILEDIIFKTGFKPKKVIWRSSYWGTSQIGAVHYQGEFKDAPAVLKIQGVKPEISEIYMIDQFATQNRSKVIRPPQLFKTIPWSDSSNYEALIMEHVTGTKILESKRIQTRENISRFLDCYSEYRLNCLPTKPWLPKPNQADWRGVVEKLITVSTKAYPGHPFRNFSDFDLTRQAASVLEDIYSTAELEFIHSHFSVEDLIYQQNEVILFSNLFWKWKYPFSDAVFGYHWFIYELGEVEQIGPEQIEQQRQIWMSLLFNLPHVKMSLINTRLLKATLLERAISGLLIDSFLVNRTKPIAKYLTDSTREQVKYLMFELS